MRFNVQDHAQHPDFLTPHALFIDRDRRIHWAALLRPTGLAVYMALLNHAGYQSRTCYPSESTLARETGMSMPQVKREIKKLIAFGMIERQTPKQKAFFDLPDREKQSNTYTILDKTAWHLPENYKQPKQRADRGKAHHWKDRPEQLRLEGSICEIPEVVSERYQGSISQIPDQYLTDTQNNRIENNRIEVTASTTTTTAAEISAETDDDVDDDVATAINLIFKREKRGERITAQLVQQIVTIHGLQSPAEVLCAVQALAAQPHIRSVIAVLKGKRTPSGYESGCFDAGKCYLYTPDDTPPVAPTPATSLMRGKSEAQTGRIMAEVESQLAAHRAQMSPAEYARAYDDAFSQRLAGLAASIGAAR